MSADEALERRRTLERDKKRRYRAKKKAEAAQSQTAAPPTPEPRSEQSVTPPSPPQEEVRRGGSADGRILGVIGLPRPGNAEMGYPTHSEILYKRGERTATPSYEQWLGIPYEEKPSPATLITPVGRYSFFPTDEHDIARVASLAVDDIPGVSENDLRATLSKVESGRTFTLDAPEEP